MQKMSVQAPPKVLVEKYLIEIAKNYNVPYEPDQKVFGLYFNVMSMAKSLSLILQILDEAEEPESLIELGEGGSGNNGSNNLGGGASGGAGGGIPQPGFVGYPYMPMPAGEIPPHQPFQYPAPGGGSHQAGDEVKVPLGDGASPFAPYQPNIPPNGGQGAVAYPPHGYGPNEKELNFNYPPVSK